MGFLRRIRKSRHVSPLGRTRAAGFETLEPRLLLSGTGLEEPSLTGPTPSGPAVEASGPTLDAAVALAVTTAPELPPAVIGQPYRAVLQAEGGTAPYTWSFPGGTAADYVEVAAGSSLPASGQAMGWQGDDVTFALTLPWTFTFYGTDYSQVFVNTNGYLDFGSNQNDYSNSTAELNQNARIAPLWDDLRTDGTGDIYVDTHLSDRVRIRWQGQTYSGSSAVDVSVTLFRDGAIRFDYHETISSVTPTVGIASGDGTHQTLSSLDGATSIAAGTAVVFTRPAGNPLPAGLSLNPATGEIQGTPTSTGVTVFSATVQDAAQPAASVTQEFTLAVRPLGLVNDPTLPPAVIGQPYEVTLQAIGGTGPYAWSLPTVTGDAYVETEPEAPLAASGQAMGWQADDATFTLTLPWTFTFYGTEYSQVFVNTNGYLDFAVNQNDYSNSTNELGRNVRIAPLWDDLRTDTGDIYVDTSDPNAVRIRWQGQTYSGSNPVDFSVTLSRNGAIRFDYHRDHAGLTPTIGISGGDPASVLLSQHDGATQLAAGTRTRLALPVVPVLPDGLSLDGATGRIHGTATTEGVTIFPVIVTDSGSPAASIRQELTLSVVTAPVNVPEIQITGNGQVLVSGDTTPATADGTDFGPVTQGGLAAHLFTVTNLGTAPLSLGGISLTGAADFAVSQVPAATVAPGEETTFVVTFQPSGVGPRTATLVLSSNDADEQPFTFALQGEGRAAPAPEILVTGGGLEIVAGDTSPRSADGTDFGVVEVGALATRSFAIRNTGTADLSLTGVQLTGSGDFQVTQMPAATLAPGASTILSVAFAPSGSGVHTATVTIDNNDADEQPTRFALQGTATVTVNPEIVLRGNGLEIASGDTTPRLADGTDFGAVDTHGAPVTRSFLIENTGTGTLSLGAVTVTGSGDFTVGPVDNASLAPGQQTRFTVTFAPTRAGSQTATVSLATNDADENPTTFRVQGRDLPLAISTEPSLPVAAVGSPYDVSLGTVGGLGAVTWSLPGGTGGDYVETDPGDTLPASGQAMGWQGDDVTFSLTLPWSFNFYGTDYSQVFVNTNGYLDFASNQNDYSNSTAELGQNVRIAPLWDDLRTDGTGDIYVDTSDSDRVRIRWQGQTYSGSSAVDVSVTLFRDGTIRFDYHDAISGVTPTIGLSAGDGTHETLSQLDGTSTIGAGTARVFAGAGGSVLPAGLRLDSSTGRLHGTPTVEGVTQFTAVATDSGQPAQQVSRTFTLEVSNVRPRVQIRGNDLVITSGDTTPAEEDATDFGAVDLQGAFAAHLFTVTNTGTADLILASVSVSGSPDFRVAQQPAAIVSPGDQAQFVISFDPARLGLQTATVTIDSNDPAGPATFRVQGRHRELQFTTPALLPVAPVGNAYHVSLGVAGGTGPYTLSLPAGGQGDYAETTPADAQGPSGQAMGWQGDDVTFSLTLPWTFTYYGTAYSQVHVNTNGYLDFGSSQSDYSNSTSELTQHARIAPLWDDLRTDGTGDIYVDTAQSDRVRIRWVGRTYSGGSPVDVSATLFRDGAIRFDYHTDISGVTPTIGIASGDGTHQTLSALDGTAQIAAGTALRFAQPPANTLPPGLTLDLRTGELSGRPTVQGRTAFTVRVTDSGNPAVQVSRTFILDVTPPAPEIRVLGNGRDLVAGQGQAGGDNGTDFGATPVTGNLVSHLFTIRNEGGAALSLGAVTLAGDPAFQVTQQPAGTLAPGQSTNLVIRFDPSRLGLHNATVTIGNNDGDEAPFRFVIQGTGIATTAPELAVSGNGYSLSDGDTSPWAGDGTDFGALNPGQTASQVYVIENHGTAPLTLGTAHVSGGEGFTVTQPVQTLLQPGERTTFTVTFAPQSVGARTATVSLTSDDADENPFTFQVQGYLSPA